MQTKLSYLLPQICRCWKRVLPVDLSSVRGNCPLGKVPHGFSELLQSVTACFVGIGMLQPLRYSCC